MGRAARPRSSRASPARWCSNPAPGSDSARRARCAPGRGGPSEASRPRNDAGVTTACGLGALESHRTREGVSMAKRATLPPAGDGFSGPQVCELVGITYASSTTGRAPDYYGRPSPRREAADEAPLLVHDVLELKVISSCSTPVSRSRWPGAPSSACASISGGPRLGEPGADRHPFVLATATGRSSTSSPVARACSTSCRCRESWTSWLPTSSGSSGGSRRRPGAGAGPATSLEPPGSERGNPLPARRRGHPSGAPAATVRFATRASASSPRSLTSTRSAGSTSRRVRTALGR